MAREERSWHQSRSVETGVDACLVALVALVATAIEVLYVDADPEHDRGPRARDGGVAAPLVFPEVMLGFFGLLVL